MNNSTHRVEIVPVKLETHPNADSLSIVRVFDGYTVCVRTSDWEGKELGAYVPPDSIYEGKRIKVKKLRGVPSMGMLLPAPIGSNVGDDVASLLGVTHYNPPEPLNSGGDEAQAPKGYRPVYDVESLRRYAKLFEEGEPIWITEKIHGANARYCFSDGEMHAGSRTTWKKKDYSNQWWKALKNHPEVEEFCRENPDITVYGEVYGQVQDLKYGCGQSEVHIAVFDLLRNGEWISPQEARLVGWELPWVPYIGIREFNLKEILALAERDTLVEGASHIAEGIVIKPLVERTDHEVGRVCMKVVSNQYLER